MFVVVTDNLIAYVGSWVGANGFGRLCLLAGDRPLVRRARAGEVAAYKTALTTSGSLPATSA